MGGGRGVMGGGAMSGVNRALKHCTRFTTMTRVPVGVMVLKTLVTRGFNTAGVVEAYTALISYLDKVLQ